MNSMTIYAFHAIEDGVSGGLVLQFSYAANVHIVQMKRASYAETMISHCINE